jgi:predicted ATPase/signal transduction histidine kinase
MTELTSFILERLCGDGEFVLFRGKRDSDLAQVLVVSPALEQPVPETIARLQHAYSLAGQLDPTWAARPLELVHHEGRPALLVEDPGGDPLERVLGQSMELSQFLRIAIGIAVALRSLHACGIIHRNVKPGNILVDSATGHVWLTGFGIASPLPRERQLPEPPAEIAGTLAYMAPEQTGRMNRSIDSRSDLYAYGVTLYEMLTGVLPFTASDPMEWVHCHIARQPMLPSERVKGLPESISAIVMKLLAKTPEERYQTAAGVEADLRSCLAALDSVGRIAPLPLGMHDMSDRLLIPEKLYGREREIHGLLAAFDRVAAGGVPEFVFMSGYSGVGKSSVVNELYKHLIPRHGLFASCKFEQRRRDIPYATLAQAFHTLIDQILVDSDAEVSHWRNALREAVGPNGQLIVNLIPELEFVIGKQPPIPELAPLDAQNRFQLVFRRFVDVFARPEHPLALFLDDLQWLDTATLELIEHLITEREVRHLLLVGAYADNEVGSSHPLMQTFDVIRGAGANMLHIPLVPLGLDDVGRLVADSLRCEQASARPLAELVHEKTGGNPFFAIQFLTALAEERLLVFDSGAETWNWDLARIRAKGYTANVVDLMAGKLSRLPHTTQEALGQLACLGNVAEIATLALVQGVSEERIHAALWDAVCAGLVFRLDSVYTFVHGRVQEAAYALIPESERAAVHLRIGRLFVSRMAPEEMEEKIFEIVNQLDRGTMLIDSPEERERIAELNLVAGKRAKTSTAYASALTYFVAGRALLAEESWERRYSLTFALEFQRAECEFLTGDYAAAEERLSMLSRRAQDFADSASVARLQTELYAALDQNDRAVAAALEYLRRAGVDWSPHPTNDEVRQEYERIWQRLGNRSIEALVDLPAMTDPACRATLDVLTATEEPAFFVDENLRCLVVARIVNLSLERGNSDGSGIAYVQLGWFVGPRFGDYEAAFRFGKLGLDLVEKRGLERFRTRVSQCFGYFVSPWSRHLRDSLDLLRRSFTTAQETGDLKYAVYCCDRLVTILLAVGDPLADVQREAETRLEFARKAKFGYIVDIIIGQLRFIRALQGLTVSLSSFNDPEFDESRFEQNLKANPHSVFARCWYWIRKLQACFYAGDHKSALEAASKAEPLLQTGPGHFEWAEYIFYSALAQAAQYDSASPEEKVRYREALAANHRQMVVWAENCPENFGNRAALLAAEIGRIEDRKLDAESLYEKAIQSAREYGFVQNEAIAYEVAARFYSGRGFETIARAYVRNARYCYLRWGAHGKVRQIDQSYPPLYEERTSSSSISMIGTPVVQLDVGTVVKASQAVSSEIVLDKLIEALMRIAVEHAGAERGVLVASRGSELQIEAEAETGRGMIAVALRHAAITPADLPESVLHYVIRTRESVVLHDALVANVFSRDEYLGRRRTRSILCLPIVTHARLVGVLYLENNLTAGAFTPDRIAVLELLASQAAISLEHAQLYADLQQENIERKRAEDELRRSEASLREAQSELARVSRLMTMGEMVASIAHEVNQPLAGVVTNANASLRWLAGDSPNLAEAREAIRRIIRDGNRAGVVTQRIRALFAKTHGAKEPLDINETIGEVVVLMESQMRTNRVILQTELAGNLPPIMGDRVQLQQAVLNLILNGVEAMSDVQDRPRELVIRTQHSEGNDGVCVAVQDSGIGVDPKSEEQIFDAFHTTKPGGLGLGLSISRSIVQGHGGRLWTVSNDGPGATFRFCVPAANV